MRTKLSRTKQKLHKEYVEWLALLGYSSSNLYEYPRLLIKFFEWMETNKLRSLKQLDKQAISEYLFYEENRTIRGEKLKNATINATISGLKNFGEFTKKTKEIILPTDHLKNKPIDTIPKIILSREEIERLYASTTNSKWGKRDRVVLGLCYGAGLRRKEAVEIQVKDIDLSRGFVHVKQTKNGKERFVPLAQRVIADLKDYLTDARPLFQSKQKYQRALFLSNKGKALGDGTLEDRLQYMLKQAQITTRPVGLHTLRHSIATHLMESGMALEDISQFLGHTSLESTQIYTHITEQKQ